MNLIRNRTRMYSVGLDLFRFYVSEAAQRKIHDDYLISDVRFLPIASRSFDGVLCSQVIEHLEKTDGLRLIEELERIAKRRVVIGTPVGFWHQEPPDVDDNPLQHHKSGYAPLEFACRGYKVRYQGLRKTYDMKSLSPILRRFLQPLLEPISYFAAAFTWSGMGIAVYMICTKMIADNRQQMTCRADP